MINGLRLVDRACSFIVARLFSPIRLEDLEVASGIKARALQMAFVKHLGCTPTQWILDRRLEAARERLTMPVSGQTVTSIALECGFAQLSRFASAYKTRCGETPLATLAPHRRW